MKIYLAGVFDLFHIGHLNILKRASRFGDLYVGVLTDKGATAYKREPIVPFSERLQIIQALKYVKQAFPQRDTDPTKYGELQAINPDILIHGDDWNQVGGQEWMTAHGKETIFLPYTHGVSTSDLITKIYDYKRTTIK